MSEELEEKFKYLESIRKRLSEKQIEMPYHVHELRALYLNTFTDQFDFWCCDENIIQRLSAYEDLRLLVVDESILISQADYHLFKSGKKF